MNKHAMPQAPLDMAPEEREARVHLAAFYRICNMFGWTELIYNHITARVPGSARHFLINQFGPMYNEITASNLVKIDVDGRVVDGSAARVNAPLHHPFRDPHGTLGRALHRAYPHHGGSDGGLFRARPVAA